MSKLTAASVHRAASIIHAITASSKHTARQKHWTIFTACVLTHLPCPQEKLWNVKKKRVKTASEENLALLYII